MELRFCPELVYLRCQQSAFSEFFFFFAPGVDKRGDEIVYFQRSQRVTAASSGLRGVGT